MSDKLKPCWKCGSNGIYVDRHGRYTGFDEDFVSCELIECMPDSEKYTVEEWQNHKSQPSREDLEKRVSELETELATAREQFQNCIELCRLAEHYVDDEIEPMNFYDFAYRVHEWAKRNRALLGKGVPK